MEPALTATEALSKDSINIVEGEVIAQTLVAQTAKCNSSIGRLFHKALVDRFNTRRCPKIISLALYLIDQESLSKSAMASYPFKLETKTVTQQFGTQLIKRLFESDENDDSMSIEEDGSNTSNATVLSFQEQLKASVGNLWTQAQTENSTMDTTTTGIKKCFRDYTERRERGPLLDKLLSALCGIPPTSTQSERNFSLCGQTVSKLRTSLTPQHVDMLSFLKSQFLNKI